MSCVEKIKNVIASVSILSAEEINMDDLLSSVGIDSLKMVELIVALEDTLDITIDDSDLDPGKLITVNSIVGLTEKYLSAEGKH